jgi:predicted Zn finger-like uncharacterized protein
MIIICQKCSSRLQVDEMKIPSRPFTIKCPKCNSNVDSSAANSAAEQTAVAVGASPSTADPRSEQAKAAPLFELDQNGNNGVSSASATDKLVELLSGLVNQPAATSAYTQSPRPSWNPRKVLVCVPEENRESIARSFAENNYQAFVAQDTRQAIERMRENRLDLVVLDPRFDPVEQGSAFVTREVNVLRPVQRRRLFFVMLSPTLRTMDAHAAFHNHVNAVVNLKDTGDLPKLVAPRHREFNELYTEFNNVLRVPAL